MAVSRTFPLGARPPFLAGRERRAQAAESSGRPTRQPRTRPPRALIAPTITGTATIGDVLTATLGSWSGTLPMSYAYQWLRDDEDVEGATSDSYLVSVDDYGGRLRVRITATNALGSVVAQSDESAEVDAVLPSNVTPPAVTGTPTQGQTLVCSTGSWSGTAPFTYTYQWRRNGSPILGATSNNYLLQAGDVGATIDCVVTAENLVGTASADSNDVGPIASSGGVAPTITVAPVLTWTVAHGSSPTITPPTYTGDPATITYDLVRLPSTTVLSGVDLATAQAYVADGATDVGPSWKVTATATNGSGSDSEDSNTVAWNPLARLPTLRLALDADVGVTLVGSDVDAWADQSGVGNDFAAASAGVRPLFVGTGFNGGSEPYVESDGAAEWLRDTAFSWGASISAYTVIAISQHVTVGNGDYPWSYAGVGSRPWSQLFVGPNRESHDARGTGNLIITTDTTARFRAFYWDSTSSYLRIGNTVNGPQSAAGGAHSDGAAFGLLARSDASGPANDRVAAFYVCGEVVSTAILDDMRAYAAWRWGV